MRCKSTMGILALSLSGAFVMAAPPPSRPHAAIIIKTDLEKAATRGEALGSPGVLAIEPAVAAHVVIPPGQDKNRPYGYGLAPAFQRFFPTTQPHLPFRSDAAPQFSQPAGFSVWLKGPIDVTVSGVARDGTDAAIVEFAWAPVVPNDLANCHCLSVQRWKGKAYLKLYDDGWRVEHTQSQLERLQDVTAVSTHAPDTGDTCNADAVDFVCGADGNTYVNSCIAERRYHTTVVHKGKCN